METKYIKITEYCDNEKIETSFVFDLNREGIIRIEKREEIDYLVEDDLPELEMFSRWHYDLGINLEGIDAMRHLVKRLSEMQLKIKELENKLEYF